MIDVPPANVPGELPLTAGKPDLELEPFDTPEPERKPWNGKGYGQKRTPEQREADLAVIEEMLGKHKRYTEIAAFITSIRPYSLSAVQVGLDAQRLTKRFLKAYVGPLADRKVMELKNLEKLEREAFDAWERSKEDQVGMSLTTFPKGEDGSSAGDKKGGGVKTNTRKRRDGDPRFLETLLKIHERRCRLLGLDAPIKLDVEVEGEIIHGVNISSLREAFKNRVLAEHNARVSSLPASADVRELPGAGADESNSRLEAVPVSADVTPPVSTDDIPPARQTPEENPLPGESGHAA